jgi:hypothetical protein
MKKIIVLLLVSVLSSGCASGNNKYFNNQNAGTLLGGGAGAVGGAVLSRGIKSSAGKVGAIAGLTLLGAWLGNSAGAWIDNKDKDRQVALINSVLSENKDNEMSTTQYTKTFRNPNTGQQQTGVVQQSATPLRTYPPENQYASNQVYQGLPNGHPDKWKSYTYSQPNQYQYNQTGVCRDMEITFTIQTDNAPPSSQQYYKMCKTEQGWRQVQ